MEFSIVLLVLISAALHPIWNLLVKKNPDPQLGFLLLTLTISVCALVHGLIAGADFSAIFAVIPLVLLSVCGQILYGTCLTATLERGDLSTYYPIIRASPVFIIIVSILFLGKSYSMLILLGISMVVMGSFILLYRRGSRFFEDPVTLLFALLALCGTGIYSLADASLMQRISPQVLMFAVDGLVFPIYLIRWLRKRSRAEITGSNNKPACTYLCPVTGCYLLPFVLSDSGGLPTWWRCRCSDFVAPGIDTNFSRSWGDCFCEKVQCYDASLRPVFWHLELL